jgi:hypothetical protein
MAEGGEGMKRLFFLLIIIPAFTLNQAAEQDIFTKLAHLTLPKSGWKEFETKIVDDLMKLSMSPCEKMWHSTKVNMDEATITFLENNYKREKSEFEKQLRVWFVNKLALRQNALEIQVESCKEKFSESEAKKLVRFLSGPLGKKMHAVGETARKAWFKKLNKTIQPKMQEVSTQAVEMAKKNFSGFIDSEF